MRGREGGREGGRGAAGRRRGGARSRVAYPRRLTRPPPLQGLPVHPLHAARGRPAAPHEVLRRDPTVTLSPSFARVAALAGRGRGAQRVAAATRLRAGTRTRPTRFPRTPSTTWCCWSSCTRTRAPGLLITCETSCGTVAPARAPREPPCCVARQRGACRGPPGEASDGRHRRCGGGEPATHGMQPLPLQRAGV